MSNRLGTRPAKSKFSLGDQWPDMFGRLSDIMQLKTWPEAAVLHNSIHAALCTVTTCCSAISDENCPEWCSQWVAAARRFEHSGPDTNLAI